MNRARRLAVALALMAPAACSPTPAPRQAPERSTTAPAASTTTRATNPASPADVGLAATDRLEHHHHLAQVLPHATAAYRIDFTVAADGRLALRVTLLAVLNGPADLGTYRDRLRAGQAEALAFIRSAGDDPATYTVTFVPDPTAPSPKEGP